MPQFARFKGAQPAVTAMSKEKHKNDFCMCGECVLVCGLDVENESENRECETPSLDRAAPGVLEPS